MNSFYFDISKSLLYSALPLKKIITFIHGITRITSYLIYLCIPYWIALLSPIENYIYNSIILKITYVILLIFIPSFISTFFYQEKIDEYHPPMSLSETKEKKNLNLAQFINLETTRAVQKTIQYTESNNIPIAPALIVFHLSQISSEIRYVLLRCGLPLSYINSYAEQAPNLNVPLADIFERALTIANKNGNISITSLDLLLACFELDEALQKLFFDINIEKEDLETLIFWHQMLIKDIKRKKRFWEYPIPKIKKIGLDWAAGWTPYLSRFSSDITQQVIYGTPYGHVIGITSALEQMGRILSLESKNNVVLIGAPGSGRTAALYAFARKVIFGSVNPELIGKHIFDLNISFVLSGAKNKGDIEARLIRIFSEAHHAGNIILFVEDIKKLLEDKIGSVNATEILINFLNSPRFQLIATASPNEWQQLIERDTTLSNLLVKVELPELSKKDTTRILLNNIFKFESKRKVITTFQAIKSIVNLSDRFIKDRPFPEKALRLLDLAVSKTSDENKDFVTSDIVESIISDMLKVPIGDLKKHEKEVLLNLESELHKRVIGQDHAIKLISSAMRRARSEIRNIKKPIGNFLFVGPTGVGKTETAKALAELFFGTEKRMIRFDMSEYQDTQSIYRLIGSPHDDKGGQLTNAIRENPFSVILFDEIEKAHPDILNLFLQLFDEGRLTDSQGRTADFTNAIIIATSNAGAEFIREAIQTQKDMKILNEQFVDYLLKNGIFKPELLNRFDAIIQYLPLSRNEIEEVARIIINNLRQTILHNKGVSVEITDPTIIKLAQLGYQPEFGARPMRRVIQDKIEDFLATKFISGELNRGDIITITKKDII